MFENFTFGAAPVNFDQYDDNVQPSPRDDSYPVSSSPATGSYPFFDNYNPSSPLDDIINQFRKQSLSYEDASDIQARQCTSPTPSLSEDSEMSSPSNSTRSVPTTPTSPYRAGVLACRRLQRQLNVQLQCSTTHVRDIGTLVEDMLSNNSQCNLRKSSSKPSLVPSPISALVVDHSTQNDWNAIEIEKARRRWLNTVVNDVDEAYMEEDNWDREECSLSLRRASAPSGIRKQGLRCRTSMESVGGNRLKVAKAPRMRIRKGQAGRVA
ncbi:uncharacterized protein EAF02_005356 [Botrytis sinoallii]|uniref:uncharacterized protein n=1 Tax=Botrytis sinoallii TaxID=1463999 RepID=UPI0018FF9444|nr:uncharacterized protein EAF02_005356 [Botrytis sinoallii]KAF7883436.1 hypothetical protein EAF02_005356 [Botrytis sinoallii]